MMSNDNGSVSGGSDVNQTHVRSKDAHHSYDVFLSFRGETRQGFTGHLYGALDQMGVNTFIDSEELQKGEKIDTLMESIKKSRIAIIVFSENYATSYWCLKEVTQIMKCEEAKVIQKVLPIFYNVEPRDVRNQTPGSSYARAFAGYRNESEDQIKEWKDSLKKAGALSGYTLDGQQEYPLIQQIVKEVLFLLNHKPLHVPANLVGMPTHLKEMEKLLDLKEKDVRMVGICGTGGLGKTTIAKSIYNKFANQFNHHGFLANARETCQKSDLLQLQKTLLSQIMRDKYSNIVYDNQGISMIKDKLGDKKTLLVIDDVDDLEQLQKLAGAPEWFGAGSRIIITTRDSNILENHNVKSVYIVQPLQPEDAKKLFIRILCLDKKDEEDNEKLLTELADRTGCLPLAVRVLASSLRGKSKQVWQSTLEKLRKITDREIFETLHVSYQNLGEYEQNMFLDIACFFKEQPLEYVRNALKSCEYYPDSGIGELISKSLIFIKHDRIDMHREIQELAWEIVRRESPKDLSKRSRLWIKKEIHQVLSSNTVKGRIEGIRLELEAPEDVGLSSEAFAQMEHLRLFIAHNVPHVGTPIKFPSGLKWLDWPGYSLPSLPLNHENREIRGLCLSRSSIRLSNHELQPFSELRFINFSYCTSLRKIPNLSSVSNLQSLNVEECTNLAEVHQSLGSLENLVHLNFSNCHELHTFAFSLKSRSLRDLILKGCSNLSKFPDILVEMEFVTQLCLNETAIDELPSSIEKLIKLRELYLENCKNLRYLPSAIYKLKAIRRICLRGCSELDKFPELVDNPNGSTGVSESEPLAFPELIYLGLQGCNLQEIEFVEHLSCDSKLKFLDLSGNKIITIPAGIRKFSTLQQLYLTNCKQLQDIQGLPPNIKYLSAKGCESLEQCNPLSNILKSDTDASPCIRRMDFAGCHKLTQQLCTTGSMFSTEDLFGDSRIEILHPGSEIPKWFDHESMDGSVIFSINSEQHQNIAGLAFCVVFGFDEQNTQVSCEMQVYINSQRAYASADSFPSMDSDHMWFLYVPCAMMWGWDTKMQNGQNQLKVLFDVSRSTLKSCAVHLVFKKDRQTNESLNPMNSQTSTISNGSSSTSLCSATNNGSPTSVDRALWFASGCMVSLLFSLWIKSSKRT